MIDLIKYGYNENEVVPVGLIPGRVIEQRREQYIVVTGRGEVTARLKGSYVHEAVVRDDLPCVGDFVLVQYNESGDSLIARLLPRRSKFSRVDAFGHGYAHIKANREQVVATNFDYVFIVSSLGQLFKASRITRYITPAWQSGAQPVVILTKADLVPDTEPFMTEIEQVAPGVPVHAISSHSGHGLEELDAYLKPGKTAVFLGMSGVGKSSLVNALMEEKIMDVKDIREDDSRGRHTTTHRQLLMLPSGAMIIDTPGMRELGLLDVDEGISLGFADVEELFEGCRFSDCSHQNEPGCAVQAALADGTLQTSRWRLYQSQQRENRYIDDKASFMRDRKEWGKELAKHNKTVKKHGKMKR